MLTGSHVLSLISGVSELGQRALLGKHALPWLKEVWQHALGKHTTGAEVLPRSFWDTPTSLKSPLRDRHHDQKMLHASLPGFYHTLTAGSFQPRKRKPWDHLFIYLFILFALFRKDKAVLRLFFFLLVPGGRQIHQILTRAINSPCRGETE